MATADYPTRYQVIGLHNVADSPSWGRLDADVREAVEVVGRVDLPPLNRSRSRVRISGGRRRRDAHEAIQHGTDCQ